MTTITTPVSTGATDWESIREEYEGREWAAPDETGPARIQALLAAAGLSFKEENGLVVLKQPASPFTVALVSASELFSVTREWGIKVATRKLNRHTALGDLFGRKIALWADALRTLRGPQAMLYVVDFDNWLASADNQTMVGMLELDERIVKRIVCPADELVGLLVNPFGKVYAGPCPSFEVQRMTRLSYEPPGRDFDTVVTNPFTSQTPTLHWVTQLQDDADAPALRALANHLARRVLGVGYQFTDTAETIERNYSGNKVPLPWSYLSPGEQYSLAFCAYLAYAAKYATNSTWLGMTECLNYMDLSKFFNAMNLLHAFVLATGANVFLKTDRTDYLKLAQTKLEATVMSIPDKLD